MKKKLYKKKANKLSCYSLTGERCYFYTDLGYYHYPCEDKIDYKTNKNIGFICNKEEIIFSKNK